MLIESLKLPQKPYSLPVTAPVAPEISGYHSRPRLPYTFSSNRQTQCSSSFLLLLLACSHTQVHTYTVQLPPLENMYICIVLRVLLPVFHFSSPTNQHKALFETFLDFFWIQKKFFWSPASFLNIFFCNFWEWKKLFWTEKNFFSVFLKFFIVKIFFQIKKIFFFKWKNFSTEETFFPDFLKFFSGPKKFFFCQKKFWLVLKFFPIFRFFLIKKNVFCIQEFF